MFLSVLPKDTVCGFLCTLFLPCRHPCTHTAESMVRLFAVFISCILEIFHIQAERAFSLFQRYIFRCMEITVYLTGPHIIAKLFQKICSSNSATVNYLVAWHFTLLQVYLKNKFLEGNFLGQKIYACIFWVYTVLSN